MSMPAPDRLDARLLHAHDTGARHALPALYAEAAQTTQDPRARGFYLTHAYVYALEAGLPEAEFLRAQLVAEGRESA